MDRRDIARAALQMKSKSDLLGLLNAVKREELRERGIDVETFYPFTMTHIQCYCNPNNVFRRYKQFCIKKKSGKLRQITAPRNKSYMMLLQSLNIILKAIYIPSKYAMGFTEGRSVVSNASVHKGQNYVFNIDLKDFFPSVSQARVWKRLQLRPFCFPVEIANVIAGICSMREPYEDADGVKKYKYVLPQGAPTSPIITNMICDTLDRRLAGLAKRFGVRYTRYADDITFSSMQNVYAENGEFRNELQRIVEGQGFTVNADKTRLQKRGARQEVTGIIVNSKLNVTQGYVRDIRNILYIWSRYGYTAAMSKFMPKYKEKNGYLKKGVPDMMNVIEGKLLYLKMVKGGEDPVYVKLYEKFIDLMKRDASADNISSKGTTYMESFPILQFEKKFKTTINIKVDNNKRRVFFTLGGYVQHASVRKSIKDKSLKKKKLLSISNCRDAKGQQFWLIHKTDVNPISNCPNDEIDNLNDTLNELLDDRTTFVEFAKEHGTPKYSTCRYPGSNEDFQCIVFESGKERTFVNFGPTCENITVEEVQREYRNLVICRDSDGEYILSRR